MVQTDISRHREVKFSFDGKEADPQMQDDGGNRLTKVKMSFSILDAHKIAIYRPHKPEIQLLVRGSGN